MKDREGIKTMSFNKIVIMAGYMCMSYPITRVMGWWGALFMFGLALVMVGNIEAAREDAVRRSDANIKAYLRGRGL